MGKIIGIDLGTTNSVIAVMEGGEPTVLVNSEGNRTTPSVVAFKDDQRLVGQVAKRQSVLNPGGTIFEAKRFIGRTWEEAKADADRAPYEVVQDDDGGVRFVVGDKQYTPEEISAQVLRKLVDDASATLGEKITRPCPAIDVCVRCGVCDPRNVPENALSQLDWMKPTVALTYNRTAVHAAAATGD